MVTLLAKAFAQMLCDAFCVSSSDVCDWKASKSRLEMSAEFSVPFKEQPHSPDLIHTL